MSDILMGPACQPVFWAIGLLIYAVIVAPLARVEEPPMICRLCWAPCAGEECPTCEAERESAKRVIEGRLRQDRQQKDRLIRDVEEWLEEE